MPTVGEIIAHHPPFKWIPLQSTVIDAVRIMVGHNVGALPVLDGETLVGVFSERDLMKRVIVEGLDPRTTKVADAMTRDVQVAWASDDHTRAMKTMSEFRCRHLPVMDHGKLVGFISLRDLLHVESERKEAEIKSLTDYIHYVPPSP